MFSLIITIISIALVAALALATIYYGGDAFSRGSDAAEASQIVNEGQQLQGALTLANVDRAGVTTLAGLVTEGYLSQQPADWTMDAANGVFTKVASTDAACQAVNERAGLEAADTAATETGEALEVVAADLTNNVFGCVTETRTVQYRF